MMRSGLSARPGTLLLLFAVLLSTGLAQDPDPAFEELVEKESLRYATLSRTANVRADAGEGFDVSYYRIVIRPSGVIGALSGTVRVEGDVVASDLVTLFLNLSGSMAVDSVFVESVRTPVSRLGSLLSLHLPRTYALGERLAADIYYHGSPGSSGFGSYTDIVRTDGSRWIYTLSEPYGAREWWPGVDHPTDKADSADVWITVPPGYQGISNGLLEDTTGNEDGTVTFKWRHRYPITSYLISANVGAFSTFSDWYVYTPTDSMEVVNYIQPDLPTRYPAYRTNAAKVPRMLEVFSEAFGEYPFIDERYGHIEFGWGGGMEHQTLTSLGAFAFNENTIAHELAHQWFGDLVTCRTWPDLWLNEGFATWCTAFFREKEYGYQSYIDYLTGRSASARNASGSLYVQDTSTVANLFASGRVYSKGAWVLHMLRNVLGDSVFFASMNAYANDTTLMYGTASTEDLQRNCETVSGRELDFFFDRWVFGEGYPMYTYRMTSEMDGAGYRATVRLRQTTGTTNPAYFVMPVEIRFLGSGLDSIVTVWNDSADQAFSVLLPERPDSVQIDPHNRILKTVVRESTGVPGDIGVPEQLVLAQNYPNPFNAGTVFRFGVPMTSRVSFEIIDLSGKLISRIEVGEVGGGFHEVSWEPTVATGTYFFRIIAIPLSDPSVRLEKSGKLLLLR